MSGIKNDSAGLNLDAILDLVGDEGNAFAAFGWADVEELVNSQKVGLYLNLDSGESVDLAFSEEITAYMAHRVNILDDETGEPIARDDGSLIKGFVPCSKVYGIEECEHCAVNERLTLRTAAKVVIVKNGKVTNETPILEGGPQIWKQLIVPAVSEWGRNHTFRLTRKGEGKKTKYQFVSLSNGALNKEQQTARDACLDGTPSIFEILRLIETPSNSPE